MVKSFYTVLALNAALLLLSCPVLATDGTMQDFSGTPLPLALHEGLRLEVLPVSLDAAQQLAGWIPETVNELVVLRIYWHSDTWSADTPSMLLGVGVRFADFTHDRTTYIVVQSPSAETFMIEDREGNGELARMCIWPESTEAGAGLILLYAVAQPGDDSEVVGYSATPDGKLWHVDTGSARTANGWFDIRDVNADGSFELITIRGMDGASNGFTYQAIREFDPAEYRFVANPDNYHQFFTEELAWLNWVVNTRQAIEEDPEKYMNKTGEGPYFSAEYEGKIFGFDSIIEVPLPDEEGYEYIELFNRERAKSFAMIVSYRDDLEAWLGGGKYPAAWNLNR